MTPRLLLLGPLVVSMVSACAAQRPVTAERVQRRCGPEIVGAARLIEPGRVVLLGEMHGTNEIPYFVAELACQATARGTPVTVAIEVALHEQAAVDAFLDSEGTPEDRRRLLNGNFWNRPYQDGRTSRAMLALLERLRTLRRTGAAIRVVAYDAPGLEHNFREEAMARNLLGARDGHEQEVFLVLCGNVHARTVAGTEWDATLVPMGARLREQVPELVALDAEYGPGSAWTCRLSNPIDCGVASVTAPRRQKYVVPLVPAGEPMGRDQRLWQGNEVKPIPSGGFQGYRPFVRLNEVKSPEGYDGIFYVGPLTASPPASTASLGVD